MAKMSLSYSSKDKQKVRHLARDPKAHGIDVWLDEWEIKVGDSITQKIEHALEESDFLLV